MGTIFYGLKTAIRRPRLLLGIIIGIMLGISLLISAFMTVDYLGYASIKKEINSVKVDMRVNIYEPNEDMMRNLNKIIGSIENIDGVNKCEPVFSVLLLNANFTSSNGAELDSRMFGDYPRVYGFSDQLDSDDLLIINGSLKFKNGEIAIGERLAQLLGISVGDNVTIRTVYYGAGGISQRNISFLVKGIVRVKGRLWDAVMYTYGFEFGYISSTQTETWKDPNLALIGNISYIYDLLANTFNVSNGEIPVSYSLYLNVFVDRESIVNPWNLDESINNLREIEDHINMILQNYQAYGSEFYTENYLGNKLFFYSLSMISARTNMAFQLIPSLLLGAVLALIAIWVSVNERRREIGLLKIKGAKGSQITSMLFTEAILAGVIAGLVGSFLGYVTALALIKIEWADIAKLYAPEAIINNLVWNYIIAGAIIGGVMGLLSVFIPAKRVSKLSILEAIQEYSEEIEAVDKLGKLVWIFMILGSYSLIEIGLGLPVLRFVTTIGMSSMSYLFIFIAIIFFPIEFASITLGPLLFTYASSKLIGTYATRLRGVFSALTKIFATELNYVAVRNFIRRKVRVARVIFLIALTLSFTVYYGISSATNEKRIHIDTEMRVGSDIYVGFYSPVTYNELANLTTNLTKIDGISGICRVFDTPLYTTVIRKGGSVKVRTIGLDPNYFNISFIKNSYLEDINIKKAEEKFSTGDILLSINLKRYYGKTKDGSLTLKSDITQKYYTLTIAGFLKFAPGVSSYIFQLQDEYSPMVFISNEILIDLLNSTSGIYAKALLIKIKSGYNTTAVAEKVEKNLSSLGYEARVLSFKEELERRMSFGMQNLTIYFVRIEFFMALVIAFIGMILIMAMSVYERRREVALLVTRGASFLQLAGTLISEAFLIVFLGFGLGLLVAITYSYGFLVSMTQTISFGTIPYELPPGYAIVIPSYLIYSVIIGFFAFIFASLIPLVLLLRRPISEELRIHH